MHGTQTEKFFAKTQEFSALALKIVKELAYTGEATYVHSVVNP